MKRTLFAVLLICGLLSVGLHPANATVSKTVTASVFAEDGSALNKAQLNIEEHNFYTNDKGVVQLSIDGIGQVFGTASCPGFISQVFVVNKEDVKVTIHLKPMRR